MKIESFDSYESMSLRAAELMVETVHRNPEAHLCVATGASPLGAYREVAARVHAGEASFESCSITKLDEWLGIPMSHPGSCETFIRNEILSPWGIREERYLAFDSDPAVPVQECARVMEALRTAPAFDLCVLGIGPNGHLGLNEPADELHVNPHVSVLAPTTRHHPMLGGTELERGLTLGVGPIMAARRVLLLVVGEHKTTVWWKLRRRVVTTQIPSSILHVHPDVIVLSTIGE